MYNHLNLGHYGLRNIYICLSLNSIEGCLNYCNYQSHKSSRSGRVDCMTASY